MATGSELQQLVEDFANELAQAVPDPAGWGIWLKFLIEALEKQAADNGQTVERYDLALELLRGAISERLQGHQ